MQQNKQNFFIVVQQTIDEIIPKEINYLYNYDQMKSFIDDNFDMPDKMVALLVRFLEQGKGHLSRRARSKEFHALSEVEVESIERAYANIFDLI